MDHVILPIFTMIIPVVAIVGGISVAIVRLITQGRLEELARRERIAAIERGVPADKLPHCRPRSASRPTCSAIAGSGARTDS